MFMGIKWNWGTHNDDLLAGYAGPRNLWAKFVGVRLVPRLSFWIIYTLLVGSASGGLGARPPLRESKSPEKGPTAGQCLRQSPGVFPANRYGLFTSVILQGTTIVGRDLSSVLIRTVPSYVPGCGLASAVRISLIR
jgi:hypothetical protein